MFKRIRPFLISAALACLVLSAIPAMAGQGLSFDMKKTVEKALEVYPGMESAKAKEDAARMGRYSATADFLPTFTATYSYTRLDHVKPFRDAPVTVRTSPPDVFTLNLTVHQDLFTGFRLLSSYQKAALQEEQAKLSRQDEELALILTVQTNFLNLLTARENVRSSQDSVTRLRSQLKVTQAFYDVGLKPRLDVLQAEVDLATAEDGLLQAENAVAIQEVRLNTLMARPHDEAIDYMGELAFIPFPLGLEDCMARAKTDRPDVLVMRKAVEIAEQDVDIAASPLYPQVGAEFNWSSTGDDWAVNGNEYSSTEFSDWSVSVYAKWQVFDFGSTYYGMRQAEEAARSFRADEQKINLEVVYEIKAKYLNITAAEKRIKVTQKALEQAKEGYRMAVARYQAQVGTNTDVLDAQENLTNAEANNTKALADYLQSVAEMYSAIGQQNLALLPLE